MYLQCAKPFIGDKNLWYSRIKTINAFDTIAPPILPFGQDSTLGSLWSCSPQRIRLRRTRTLSVPYHSRLSLVRKTSADLPFRRQSHAIALNRAKLFARGAAQSFELRSTARLPRSPVGGCFGRHFSSRSGHVRSESAIRQTQSSQFNNMI